MESGKKVPRENSTCQAGVYIENLDEKETARDEGWKKSQLSMECHTQALNSNLDWNLEISNRDTSSCIPANLAGRLVCASQ